MKGRQRKDNDAALEKDPLLQADDKEGTTSDDNQQMGSSSSSSMYGTDDDPLLTMKSSEFSKRPDESTAVSPRTTDTTADRWKRIARILRSGGSFNGVLRLITLSSRQKALSHTGVGQAAFLIRDALLGNQGFTTAGSYDPYINPRRVFRNAMAVICGRICSSRPVVQVLHGTAWLLLLLSFVEPPGWCRSNFYTHARHLQGCNAFLHARGVPATMVNASASDVDQGDDNSLGIVSYYPNSHYMLLTFYDSSVIEAVGLGIIVTIIMIYIGRDGIDIRTYLRNGPSQMDRIVQLVCIAGIASSLWSDYRLFLPYFRLGLLSSYQWGVKQDMKILFSMLPEVFNVLVVLGMFMSFYAWCGCVMFVGTDEGRKHFPNFMEALWTLWDCVTTAKFDFHSMMPQFNRNRWVALYFISFMVLSYFFLMNVILAGVVNEYDTAMKRRKEENHAASTRNLKNAFGLMDPGGTGSINRETVMGLSFIINEDFPEFRTLSDEDTKLLFAILDKDGTNLITEAEFMDLGKVILLEFTRTSDYETVVAKFFPTLFESPQFQWFRAVVKSAAFENTIDAIIFLNALVVGIQSYPELSGKALDIDPKVWDGSIDTVWEIAEAIFTGVYVLEVFVKLIVFGWKK